MGVSQGCDPLAWRFEGHGIFKFGYSNATFGLSLQGFWGRFKTDDVDIYKTPHFFLFKFPEKQQIFFWKLMVGRWHFLWKGFLFRGHSLVVGGVMLQPCPSRWFKGIPRQKCPKEFRFVGNIGQFAWMQWGNEMIMIVTILVRNPDITFTFVLLSILLVWFVSLFYCYRNKTLFFSFLGFPSLKKNMFAEEAVLGGPYQRVLEGQPSKHSNFGTPNLWTSKTRSGLLRVCHSPWQRKKE